MLNTPRTLKKKRAKNTQEVVTEFSWHGGRVGKCIDGNLFVAFITAGDQETGPCIWSSESKRHFLKYKKFHLRTTHWLPGWANSATSQVSTLVHIQNATAPGPEQPALPGPALSSRVGYCPKVPSNCSSILILIFLFLKYRTKLYFSHA